MKRHRHYLLGILIIALGIYFLLRNFGLITMDLGQIVATYWPLLLIIWGIDHIGRDYWYRKSGNSVVPCWNCLMFGSALIILGLLLLGHNLYWFELDLSLFWKVFWPAVIILVGWRLLRGAAHLGNSGGGHVAVMSSVELTNQGWKLESGSYTAILGGVKMDLTVADIPEGEVQLELSVILGGIDILVPAGLEVDGEGTAILGGVTFFREEAGGIIMSRKFFRKGDPDSKSRLVIRAASILGGIEIK